MSSYKIVSRGTTSRRQHKKRVYTSKEDFEKYAYETMERWLLDYDVEVYEQKEGKWIVIDKRPKVGRDQFKCNGCDNWKLLCKCPKE